MKCDSRETEINRASLLTPPGAAAIAVVRLVGPAVAEFIATCLRSSIPSDRCVHTTLHDRGNVVDDPVVVLSNAGRTLDINLHGGEWVIHQCLELARHIGFDIVRDSCAMTDGETAMECEMLESLPHAKTEQAVRLLLDQPQRWTKFKECAANQDAKIVSIEIQSILDSRAAWWMMNPPRIALIGAPNAGKSTLANALFGHDRCITADVPGTTRDWVSDWVNIDGLPALLLDTPGQRDSADAIEQAAITASLTPIARADLVVLVIDPTQPREPQDQIRNRHPNALVVVNKCDQSATWKWESLNAIQTDALSGHGVDTLRHRIVSHFGRIDDPSENRPHWWTERQRSILERARINPSILQEL